LSFEAAALRRFRLPALPKIALVNCMSFDTSFRLTWRRAWPVSARNLNLVLIPLLTLTFLTVPGCSRHAKGDRTLDVSADDPAMNAAIAKAKATSADFVRALHERKPGTTEFFVKKPYPTPGGGSEHMWIEVSDEKDGVLTGTIANDAEETREVKNGQKVTLNLSEISDWKYQDGKKLIGGYTIRYFIDKMSPKERAEFLQQAGIEL
jgi:uncharacterized protein YegJ (DUF2314 family)